MILFKHSSQSSSFWCPCEENLFYVYFIDLHQFRFYEVNCLFVGVCLEVRCLLLGVEGSHHLLSRRWPVFSWRSLIRLFACTSFWLCIPVPCRGISVFLHLHLWPLADIRRTSSLLFRVDSVFNSCIFFLLFFNSLSVFFLNLSSSLGHSLSVWKCVLGLLRSKML